MPDEARSSLPPFTFETATRKVRGAEGRLFHWPLGRHPDDHPGLDARGL